MPLCSFAGQKNGMAMQGTPHGVMSNPHTGPVMGCCWSPDGGKLFTGSADKTGKVWDLASSQVVQFAAHDQPIKAVHMDITSRKAGNGGGPRRKYRPLSLPFQIRMTGDSAKRSSARTRLPLQ